VNERKPRRPRGSDREFALLGDLGGEEEIELRQVLTWPSMDSLRQQLLAGVSMTSKEIVIAEMAVPANVGVRLPVGSEEAWLVRLGNDRPVPLLQEGMHVTFLQAEFEGAGNAKVWRLRPRQSEQAQIQLTKMGLALEMLG